MDSRNQPSTNASGTEEKGYRSETDDASLVHEKSDVEVPKGLLREGIMVAVVCMAQLMTQAALGQLIAPLHIIGDSFGTTNPGQLSWYAAAYSLTVGTFILIAGRLGDLFGHKRLFIAGFVWFGVWSLLAGFSVYTSPIFFDFTRAMQGIGPAFMLPNGVAILGRAYPPGRRKEMIFSLFGATAPTGFVLGATFASLFAEVAWWPWGYWTMGAVCFACAAIGIFFIPVTPAPPRDTSHSMFSQVDGPGCIVGVTGLILINFAWNQGPVVGWDVPYVYSLLIVGFLFMAAFFYVEWKAEFPLIPFDILNRTTGFVLACIACGWSSFGIWIFYWWQLVEVLRGYSPLLASAYMVPTTISGLAAAVTTGLILSKVPASTVMQISMTAFMTGAILMATCPVDQSYWLQTFFAAVITPWGM